MSSKLSILVALAVMGCSPVAEESYPLARIDHQVAKSHPDAMKAIISTMGKPDSKGLLGRNREWGKLYSVRFQYGAGRAFRYGVASNNPEIQRLSKQAIISGLNSIQDDGVIPASLPIDLMDQYKPGESDQASAAAFFLSDICPALYLSGVAEGERESISLASSWLTQKKAKLIHRDREAPNRLLINALAFFSCGSLLKDESLLAHADDFIGAALKFVREDGVFLEAGGSDTSYQAVNLVVANEILALGYQGPHAAELQSAWDKGVAWLSRRITAQGRLDSAGNTRTCTNEAFLGRLKVVDLREVLRALVYADATNTNDIENLSEFTAWTLTGPNPCNP